MLPIRSLSLPILVVAALACSRSDEPPVSPEAPATLLPATVEVVAPDQPMRDLETVETLSEEVADFLHDFGAALTRREFDKAAPHLAEDFAGDALGGLALRSEEPHHLGAVERTYDAESAAVLGKQDFLDSLAAQLGPFARVDLVLWKVKGAEFQAGGTRWGSVRLMLHFVGDTARGREDLTAWGWARVEKRAGRWLLTRFALESLSMLSLAERPFVEVSAAAGLAHVGVRYGKPGNVDDAWNGAAGGDVNGDGLWDLFLPSDPRNFLYIAQPGGGFRDEAAERGVQHPADGTGAVFFDHDNDGDQDLFVAHRAWLDERGEWQGETLCLYANDGEGQFENVTAQVELDLHRYGFSVSVLDYDADGWLDLFVCGYGRTQSEHNDSWIEATNGRPNALLRNLGGERFVDVAEELGMAGNRWSYASAVADFDADGDQDVYVANDYGTNRLWRNGLIGGDGTFTDAAEELGVDDLGNGMGATWGDLNSDGRLDLYVANMSSTAGNRILDRLGDSLPEEHLRALRKAAAGNSIFLAQPDGTFRRQPEQAGGIGGNWAWSVVLCDLDLDAALDVFCVNGFVTGDSAYDT